MTAIFISYRRRGSQGFAGRLADDLIERFGEARVFRDVEIHPGNNFADVIEAAIASCSVLLVLIGPQWLEHYNANGESRLHEAGDWVRLEIEAALAKNTWIVPVLVGGARMPAATALPASIQHLSRIQAFEMSDRRWDRDVEQLAAMIVNHIPGLDDSKKIGAAGQKTDRAQPHDSPARAIRDLGIRVIEEIGRTRRESPTSRRSAKRRRFYTGSGLGRLVRQLIGIAIMLGVAYFLIQNFADPATRRLVDDIISRITARL